MAIHSSEKQKCSRCGNEYEWNFIKSEKGEAVFGAYPFDNNVKNVTPLNVPGSYSIEIECPKCYKREFVIKEAKS